MRYPAGGRVLFASSAEIDGCTSWKVSRAVLPISSLSGAVSNKPGTCTRMRSLPWRTICASVVPVKSTRRRTVSIAALMASVMRCCRPASVGAMMITPPSALRTSRSVPEKPRMMLPVGCARPLSSLRAASASSGLATRTCSALLTMPMPATTILASRRRLRASSRNVSSQSLRTSAVSMDSSRWAPPRRSRPRLIWALGKNHGQPATVSLAKKLGITRTMPSTTLSTMAICFQRVKCSMLGHRSCFGAGRNAPPRPRNELLSALLDGLASGPHLRDGSLHHAHPGVVGNFHLDLLIIAHLGNLADDATGGDNGVPAAQVGDHLTVLLYLLLLLTQEQKVKDDKHQQNRNELDEEIPTS